MRYKEDDEVMTPRGKGTIVGYSNNEYLINLHAKPGTGPFKFPANRLTKVPVAKDAE
jgi:hypothetical protein